MDSNLRWLSTALLPVIAATAFSAAAAAKGPVSEKPPGFAIATAEPAATAAAAEILHAGGNAFDAAVAVSAVLSVTEPYSSGIGGGGFWLLHRGQDGFETLIDGRETAPAAARPTMYQDAAGHVDALASQNGALAAAIPGEPAALDYLAHHYGKLGLARDLAPSIRLAEKGFAIDPRFADFLASRLPQLSPAARTQFLPDGKLPSPGDILRQPDLAVTLRQMALHGRDGFYRGPVGKALVKGVDEAGGIWSAEDLAGYRIQLRKPVQFDFDGYHLTSAPPPSAGGVGLAEILQQLAALGWTGDDAIAADHQVIEAMRRTYRDRAIYFGDPAFVDVPTTRLTDPAYAKSLDTNFDPTHATPSASLPMEPSSASRRDGQETSHFSIIDADGNRVSATVTVNLRFGSGLIPPGTGVIVNDEMDDFAASTTASNAFGLIGSKANEIRPGKRPVSTMSPCFVDGPRGVMVIGTPGGSRILTMVTLGILDFVRGGDAAHIVGLPRYHMQYLPDVVEYEPKAFSDTDRDALLAMGYVLKQTQSPYGNMQTVIWRRATDSSDRLEAASDPRGVGAAIVVVGKTRQSTKAIAHRTM